MAISGKACPVFPEMRSVTHGTVAASKAVIADSNGVVNFPTGKLKINGDAVTVGVSVETAASAAELDTLASVTAGTGAASKAAVLDASGNWKAPSGFIFKDSSGNTVFTMDGSGNLVFSTSKIKLTDASGNARFLRADASGNLTAPTS